MTNKQAGWSVDNSTDNVTFQSLPDKSMAGRAGLPHPHNRHDLRLEPIVQLEIGPASTGELGRVFRE